MPDYMRSGEGAPEWKDCRNSVEKVVIGDGITSIGKNAFHKCTALMSVVIPKNTVFIGKDAFEKMTGKHVEGQSAVVGNKELMIIPDAVHTDLYDDKNGKIPYDKIEEFFKANLK